MFSLTFSEFQKVTMTVSSQLLGKYRPWGQEVACPFSAQCFNPGILQPVAPKLHLCFFHLFNLKLEKLDRGALFGQDITHWEERSTTRIIFRLTSTLYHRRLMSCLLFIFYQFREFLLQEPDIFFLLFRVHLCILQLLVLLSKLAVVLKSAFSLFCLVFSLCVSQWQFTYKTIHHISLGYIVSNSCF